MKFLDICNRLLWTFFFITIPLGVANANSVTIAFSFNSEQFSFDFGNQSTIQSGSFSIDCSNPTSVFNGTGFLLTDFQLDALSLDPARSAFWVPAPDFDNTTIEVNGGNDDQWALFDQSDILSFQLFANPDGQGGFTGDIGSGAEGSVPVFYSPSSCIISAGIDIKPGSFPNSINLGSGGATPVAILGSPSLDVNDIDTDTLTFGTSGVKTVGKTDRTLCSVVDVSGDFSFGPEGFPDGFDDLVCHFITMDIAPEAGDTTATISGELNDGTAIEGTDSVNIVP